MAREQLIDVIIRGVRPLIMHNGMLADPLYAATKEIRAITARKKLDVEDKAEQLRRAEFMGSMYYDPVLGPVIPTENIERLVRDGAADEKRGRDVQADLEVFSPEGGELIALEYDGPRDPEKLLASPKHCFRKIVRVQRNRVVRTRPRFPEWELRFQLRIYPWASITADVAQRALVTAGARKGLCDWRPRYGLFEVVKFKTAKG